MVGITGILRPNGELVACDYGNHCTIAIDIPEEEGEECIYLSSSKNEDNTYNSIIYFNEVITKKQIEWFMKNINLLDEKQYDDWIDFIRGYINAK